MGKRVSRRRVLASAGVALAGGVATVGLDEVVGASPWSAVASPTSKTLYEVVMSANEAYAVGGSGMVVHRTSSGWETAISDGPKGQNKTLLGASTTDDGQRLWMAGSSGALGEYDVTTGELTDWSNPRGISNNFYDIEVRGTTGDKERIYLAMSSGNVVVGKREKKNKIEWDTHNTGGSYTLNAIDFHTKTSGRVVSNGYNAYETTDGGKTWTDISTADAQNTFYTVVSGTDHVYVGAANGQIWRQDCNCDHWTPHSPGSKGVRALVRQDGELLGVGESGRVFEREGPLNKWVSHETPVGNVLLGCIIGDPDIAVGKSGTIIER